MGLWIWQPHGSFHGFFRETHQTQVNRRSLQSDLKSVCRRQLYVVGVSYSISETVFSTVFASVFLSFLKFLQFVQVSRLFIHSLSVICEAFFKRPTLTFSFLINLMQVQVMRKDILICSYSGVKEESKDHWCGCNFECHWVEKTFQSLLEGMNNI